MTADRPADDATAAQIATRIAALRDRLAAGPVTTPDGADPGTDETDRRLDFAAWWLRTARLAVCGETGPFESWPAVAGRLGIDVLQAIREAARDGVRQLAETMGEPLAEAILDAEDAACLLEAETRITGLLPELAPVVEAWLVAADQVVLDEEAREIVLDHRDAWPVPDAVRLPVVSTPLGDLDIVAAAATRAWSPPTRLAEVFEYEEVAAQFHQDGLAPEAMRERFAQRRGEAVLAGGLLLRVNPRLDAYWGVFVELVGEAATRVRSVRLGTWPLRPVADEAGSDADGDGGGDAPMRLFELTLAGQPLDVRLRLVSSDIGITTTGGERYLL